MAIWMGKQYWEAERPKEVDSGNMRFRFYSKAGKLQIGMLYVDKNTKDIKQGKTITLDAEDLQLHRDAVKLIIKFLKSLES